MTAGNSVSGTVDTSTTTFTFSNPTASDELCAFSLVLINGGSQTVNWPGTVDWAGGTAPTLTTAGVDILVFATGTQKPIGLFSDCDFDEWANSIQVNFTNQLRIVKRLIPIRNKNNILGPCVLFFAGGGTNNATVKPIEDITPTRRLRRRLSRGAGSTPGTWPCGTSTAISNSGIGRRT